MSSPVHKIRLDQLLVDRELCHTTEEARRFLMAGQVRVAGRKAPKPGDWVREDIVVEVDSPERYVSRGGYKLEAGLVHFGIDPTGWICLDIGSSTGGFTDCLLQHGAERVIALDAGTNQMAWKIRSDPRVDVRENFNVRHLTPATVPESVDLLVADVSFISLTLVLPPACGRLRSGGVAVVLIKPQFELPKEKVDEGGVVTDPLVRREAIEKIRLHVEQELGCVWVGWVSSPLRGGRSGNEEFLACFRKP